MSTPMGTPMERLRHHYAALPEAELVQCIQRGEAGAFRHLMTSCNQRLFRVARGILRSDHEAEDVVQESYVTAYEHLRGFRGGCTLLTWLTRIVINEARQRIRDRKATVDVEQLDQAPLAAGGDVLPFPAHFDPAGEAARSEFRHLLEVAIDELPSAFRIVYIMRELEQCSVEETAENLGLLPQTVKTRLHRARRLLRLALEQRVSASLQDAFQFLGARCERICTRVLQRLGLEGTRAGAGIANGAQAPVDTSGT